jgi:hypothetical protein
MIMERYRVLKALVDHRRSIEPGWQRVALAQTA